MTEHPPLFGNFAVSFAEARILCVGDVMLDRFVTGTVERISPEAPIPVMRVVREAAMLGGAGNVVRNLAGLESHAVFLGVIGEDAAGTVVQNLLSAHPYIQTRLEIDKSRKTSVKTRFIAGTQQILRTDEENVSEISSVLEKAVLAHAEQAVATCRIVLLSDYGKGLLTPALTASLIDLARRRNLPVVIDPKGRDYRRYRGANVVTPNLKELREASSHPVETETEIVQAARRIITTFDIKAVLATRGQYGMSLVQFDGNVQHFPARALEVFDVSGAGDTVAATLAAALAAGASLETAVRLSNVAAGIVVGKVGTAAVHIEEIRQAICQPDENVVENKILSLPLMLEQVERWRRQGCKIGFANGCFDLLHPGHLSLLRQAKNACDRLVVGLNSDASVKRLKGESRPAQLEKARAEVLAALTLVDAVVIFEEDTPLNLIEALLPDLLIKGEDYALEAVVGADAVLAAGGKVLLARLEPNCSTTRTLSRIAQK